MRISFRGYFMLLAASQLSAASGDNFDHSPVPMNLFRRDTADSICQPVDGFSNAASTPFPCNKEWATMTVCSFVFSLKGRPPTPEELKQEQQCLCTSNGRGNVLWRYALGCQDCRRLHGGKFLSSQELDVFSSSYCASTATVEFKEARSSFLAAAFSTQTASRTDVLGTRTEVSLYWTDAPGSGGSRTPSTTTAKETGASQTSNSQTSNTQSAPTGSSSTTPNSSSKTRTLSLSPLVLSFIVGLGALL